MKIKPQSELLREYRELVIAFGVAFDAKGQFTDLVRKDLARFCRANEDVMSFAPDGSSDPLKIAYLAGRRSVWLHIEEFLTNNAEALLEKHARPVSMKNQPFEEKLK